MAKAQVLKAWTTVLGSSRSKADVAVKNSAEKITKILATREKLLTGVVMAEKGYQANKPLLTKSCKSLLDESVMIKAEIIQFCKLSEKKGGTSTGKMPKPLEKSLTSFCNAVQDCQGMSGLVATQYIGATEKTWKKLRSAEDDQVLPSACVKPFKKRISVVDKLLKQLKSQSDKVEKSKQIYLGCLTKINLVNNIQKQSSVLKVALKSLGDDANKLSKQLVGIETMLKDYRGPGPLK